MTIESENMYGVRFYSVFSTIDFFQSSQTKENMIETPVYEHIRPICWRTMYENKYLEKDQYQKLVKKLTDEFDEDNETRKTRMISSEDLQELTKDWEEEYSMSADHQNQLIVNKGSFFQADYVDLIRLFVTIITVIHCALRIFYFIQKYELYRDHMLFMDMSLAQTFSSVRLQLS